MESTEVTRIKCGQIYVLSNNEFSLICKFCGNDFFTLDDLRAHLNEHFSDSPTIIKKEVSNDSRTGDCGESISPYNMTDAETAAEPNMNLSTQCEENQPNWICEHSAKTLNENEYTTEAEMENTHSNRYPKRLRKGMEKSREKPTPMPMPILQMESKGEKGSRELNFKSHSIAARTTVPIKELNKGRDPYKLKAYTQFQCNFCPKKFNSNNNRKEHENTHTGNRPYNCKICSKAFASRRNISAHEKIHKGSKPHQCKVCNRTYTERRHLDGHTRANHLNDTDPQRFFPCKLCDVNLKSNPSLLYHIRTVHRNSNYECDYCQRQFKRKDLLNNHMIVHFDLKPHKCNICQKTFNDPSAKRRHEMNCVPGKVQRERTAKL